MENRFPLPRWRQYVTNWLTVKEHETARASMAAYRKSAEKFLAFLGASGDVDIGEIRQTHILGFRNETAKKLAPQTAFDESFTDHLIDRRLHESRANRFPLSSTLAEAKRPWDGCLAVLPYSGRVELAPALHDEHTSLRDFAHERPERRTKARGAFSGTLRRPSRFYRRKADTASSTSCAAGVALKSKVSSNVGR